MAADQAVKRIVVGVDGSEPAAKALDWAIRFARAQNAEILAVFAISPAYNYWSAYAPPAVPPEADLEWRANLKAEFEQEWVKSLAGSGVTYRTVIADGRPASVIENIADSEGADMIVVGRRGRGGVTEFLLGSVSHELSHSSRRPVLLVP